MTPPTMAPTLMAVLVPPPPSSGSVHWPLPQAEVVATELAAKSAGEAPPPTAVARAALVEAKLLVVSDTCSAVKADCAAPLESSVRATTYEAADARRRRGAAPACCAAASRSRRRVPEVWQVTLLPATLVPPVVAVVSTVLSTEAVTLPEHAAAADVPGGRLKPTAVYKMMDAGGFDVGVLAGDRLGSALVDDEGLREAVTDASLLGDAETLGDAKGDSEKLGEAAEDGVSLGVDDALEDALEDTDTVTVSVDGGLVDGIDVCESVGDTVVDAGIVGDSVVDADIVGDTVVDADIIGDSEVDADIVGDSVGVSVVDVDGVCDSDADADALPLSLCEAAGLADGLAVASLDGEVDVLAVSDADSVEDGEVLGVMDVEGVTEDETGTGGATLEMF